MIKNTDELTSLTVSQLKSIAEDAGIKVRSKTRKNELVEIVSQISDGAIKEQPDRADSSLRRKRLRGRSLDKAAWDSEREWIEALEHVIQISIQELSERFINNYYVSGMRDLESVIFTRNLKDVLNDWLVDGRRIPSQLLLFSNPIGFVTFQVHERKYQCIKYPPNGSENGFSNEVLEQYKNAINQLSKQYSSETTYLEEKPTTPELVSHLFDHLLEEVREEGVKHIEREQVSEEDYSVLIHHVHPARRSAIRDWQTRLEERITEIYSHSEKGDNFYAYPVVDVVVPDSKHLVLLMISPLDLVFVDEKVTPDHRCSEICLAIFNVEKTLYPGAEIQITPYLKQAFGRVLFTSMHKETSQALSSSFNAQTAILRNWVSEAAKGYDNLVEVQKINESFNGEQFCEALVRQVLCAKIPGVDTEIYPFDRAFIFKEAGASSRFNKELPIEVIVLEASVLSNNPADRGLFLTRRERNIRGTEDYECDTSEKTIKEENHYSFYVHGGEQNLILSRKSYLSPDDKLEIARGVPTSYTHGDPETRPLLVPIPEENAEEGLSLVLYNLFGRLVPSNYTTKFYDDPTQQKQFLHSIEAYSTDFERKRLQVTEKFDETGLLYIYEHGLNFIRDIPLLDSLQSAYFHFLDLKYGERDIQYRRETLRQENLSEEQINDILDAHQLQRSVERKEGKSNGREKGVRAVTSEAAKVVYISYSWLLNDENMQRMLLSSNGRDAEDSQRTLLGDEYTYTMILVSDKDPEKSLSQLNAERENLKLFLKLIMQQIWLDKVTEFEYLQKKSRTIGDSLGQFLHRARAHIPNEEGRQEMKVLYDNIYRQIQPAQKITKDESIADIFELYALLLGQQSGEISSLEDINRNLHTLKAAWFSKNSDLLRIEMIQSFIPKLQVRWPKTIVQEAFYVIFKNACEAALTSSDNDQEQPIRIQVQAIPTTIDQRKNLWNIDIVVENPGGHIPPQIMTKLRNPDPSPLSPNERKEVSTGIGVFLARYQLLNNIGDGADILYSNLENDIVQARLRLPAVLEAKAKDKIQDITSIGKTLDRDYILYVEDEKNFYEQAIPALKELLEPLEVDLHHKRGLMDAVHLVRKRLPKAIFSDLHIVQDETSADPAFRWGLRFIESVMDLGKANTHRPPILVLTAEDENVVREHLGDVTRRGYRFIPYNDAGPLSLSEQGIICVFSLQKRPDEIKFLPQFFIELFGSDKESDEYSKANTVDGFTIDFNQVNHVAFPLNDAKFDELGDKYLEIQTNDPNSVFVIHDQCSNINDIGTALGSWFKHSGFTIYDPLLKSETQYFLTNHVWHKNLVLHLTVDENIYKKLQISLLYWGLRRNVLIGKSDMKNSEVANRWRKIRHEDRGPFSTLRHDIKNQWSNPELSPALASTLEIISSCEQAVFISNEIRSNLDAFVSNNEKALTQLKVLSKKEIDVSKDRKQIRHNLQLLDNKLLNVLVIDETLIKTISEHRSMLHILDDYLGGN